jgi:hypothetical protein
MIKLKEDIVIWLISAVIIIWLISGVMLIGGFVLNDFINEVKIQNHTIEAQNHIDRAKAQAETEKAIIQLYNHADKAYIDAMNTIHNVKKMQYKIEVLSNNINKLKE